VGGVVPWNRLASSEDVVGSALPRVAVGAAGTRSDVAVGIRWPERAFPQALCPIPVVDVEARRATLKVKSTKRGAVGWD